MAAITPYHPKNHPSKNPAPTGITQLFKNL